MFLWACILVAVIIKVGLPMWVGFAVVAGYLWHLFMMYGSD